MQLQHYFVTKLRKELCGTIYHYLDARQYRAFFFGSCVKGGTKATNALFFVLFLIVSGCTQRASFQPLTPFEKSEGNTTATYDQAIDYYRSLADHYATAQLLEYGTTDVGKPLHLVVLSKDRQFEPKVIREAGKSVLLINNAIHPGEPCGVDASMMLARDLLQQKHTLLDSVVVLIIPVYNIGGALNRGCCTRANQNGPKEKGFRGNARNLDLNRDFIKCDSRNARAFAKIFQTWWPDLFIDTHTSNGADYRHVMTLITSQKDKLNKHLADYQQNEMLPVLRDSMTSRGYNTVPYVYTRKRIPDSGLKAYLETGRYSTGYAALFNTMGFVTETHMLKPYDERVRSTYAFLEATVSYMNRHTQEIRKVRQRAQERFRQQTTLPLRWELDTSTYKMIPFRGYQAEYTTSKVTGQQRLYYNRSRPFEDSIPYYNTYRTTVKVKRPKAYIVPQAWHEVIELLQLNEVEMHRLEHDTSMTVEVYYIEDYQTVNKPYEGHYLHHNTKVRKDTQAIRYYRGDYLIPADQVRSRFLAATLEPEAHDSYFNWNFFDAVLMQKEYFSSYVFDDKADEILAENPALKKQFEAKKEADQTFAQSHRAQLDYIYKHSRYYEKTHKRYPVARVYQ